MIAENVFGFTQYSAVSIHHHLDYDFDPRQSRDVLSSTDKRKNIAYHTVRTAPQSKSLKIIETESKINIFKTHIYDSA